MLYYQEDEVTDELITFHEAVNQMQLQEEELIDTHHQLIEVVWAVLLSQGMYCMCLVN